MRRHVQLSRSAQVCGYSRSPPDALFPNHQQRGGHQDPHRWRGRAQRPVRGNIQQSPSVLQPTKPFSGITDGSTVLIGQVCLPVTFGARDNYRTKLIDFDVPHIRLPYNAILGYPALAKFMAVTHHGYNVLKMPGSGGVITVPCEEKDAVCSLERAFQAASLEDPDCGSRRPPETAPKKKNIVRSDHSGGRPLWARAYPGGTSLHCIRKRARRPPQAGLGGSPLEGHRPG